MAEDEDDTKQVETPKKEPAGSSWSAVATVVAGVIAALGFLGISNAEQLGRFVSPEPSASTTSTYSQDMTTSHEPTTEESTTTTDTTSEESETSSDLESEPDIASSGETPFTWDALLTSRFTTDLGVPYALGSKGSRPCGQAYGMSDAVTATLTGYGCTGTMVGTYLVDTDTVTADNQILVSVQVVQFNTATQARGAYNSFRDADSWEFGIWCPQSGAGQNACTDGYESARNNQRIRVDERYLIEATAVYTSFYSAEGAVPWIVDASQEAAAVSGPQ